MTKAERMEKKAIIEIALVEECAEKTDDAVARDIFDDLADWKTLIPWCKHVKKVVISDGRASC
jgi:hypothetical protein